ncbi:MAG: 6-pyruvoyl-tetrahydropterin synthase-related protein, partial [Candidatus Bathyarchaeia archaeon]
MGARRPLQVMLDLTVLELLTIGLVLYLFKGATSMCDGFIHLSKVRIIMDTIKSYGYFPRWNLYWYFGIPMWRIYSPMSYYIAASIGWIFNLSMVDTVMAWTYLVFSVATVSMYLLGRELNLGRAGCLASSILFLTSRNLILYWGNGSYPNVTGATFSPLALLFFLRAVKRRSFMRVLAAGLSFSLVLLTYFMNALILFFFIVVISIVLAIADPSLIYIARDVSTPPKYTLDIPKVLISMLLVALVLGSWWTLPFLKTYIEASTIPEALSGIPEGTATSLLEQLLRIIGVHADRDLPFSPGMGHIALALVGCGFAASRREVKLVVPPVCLTLSFIFDLAPWLGIPTGFFFWWRFSLYFSLFAALCGGIATDSLKKLYQGFLHTGIPTAQNKRLVNVFYSTSMITLILLVSVYPVVGSGEFIFPGYDFSELPVPVDIGLLKSHIKPGGRVAAEGSLSYWLNLFSDIPQSGGGNVHYVYMVNQFAYIFWRYMFVEKDGGRLQYFARNYNVRWLIDSEMPGLVRTDPRLPYEVEGFNSSFAELIRPGNNLILYVGKEDDYSQLFLSVAASNPRDIILIYGGTNLKGYNITTLRNFDLVYLATWKGGGLSELSQLLTEYVESGGCLILDTGNIEYGGELEDIPDPFPVQKTSIDRNSHLTLNPTEHDITAGVDFTKFRTTVPYTISYAESLKEDAITLLYEQDRPVLVYRNLGLGKAFWTGLRLPHLAMLNEWEMKNKEEKPQGTRLILNLLRCTGPSKPS